MPAAVTNGADTLGPMGKKKSTSGKHTTVRQNVGVPEEWHAVMRKLAAAKRMPVLWMLVELVAREADAAKIPRPVKMPWEADPE